MGADEEEFSELVDPDMHRVDAVKAAANGTQWLIAKQADEGAGLLDAQLVRDLVAKADGGELDDGAVTVTGRPGAVAAVMHKIHQAAAATNEAQSGVLKAKMSAADINDLPDSAFAHIEPGGTKDSEGKTTPRRLRHYPVHDEEHARDALGRAGAQIKSGDADGKRIAQAALPKIRSAAKKFGINVTKADADATDPGSPGWESQDAASAETVVGQILACIPSVKQLVMREATEVGAGHLDDIGDVLDLQGAIDALTCAAQCVGAFAVSEHAEAGETVTKAQEPVSFTAAPAAPAPKESIVSETQGATGAETVAKAAEAAPTAGDFGLSQAQLAEYGRQAILKAAREAAAADQTSGASPAPADTARVIPGTDTVQAPALAQDDVSKAAATEFATVLATVMAPVVKQLSELTTQVNADHGRVEKALAKADDRRSPLLNGATGALQLADRSAGTSPVKSPEFQAVLKAINELPVPADRENAQRAVGIAAIKARFGHAD